MLMPRIRCLILVSLNLLLFTVKEKQKYSSIGGQAVIEGVMMRSPHAFVIALRLLSKKIRLRKDQWYGASNKHKILKKPFLRGIMAVIESMANGIVALNYSANVAMQEEILREQQAHPEKKIDRKKSDQLSEKIGIATFITMAFSLLFGIGLFIFIPHWFTILLGHTDVQSFEFHLVDGLMKSIIFVLYIFLIGLLPDIKKIFQYHGAEHKAIATFEAGEELTISNAQKHSTLHPRCGTSFIFFLIFISILIFSIIFASINIGSLLPFWTKHIVIIFLKILLMFPVAGISYEIIKIAGAYPNTWWSKVISIPGMVLQKITTKEPDDNQVEVAISSIKTVLFLEDKFTLKEQKEKILKLEEIEVDSLDEIEKSGLKLSDFLE
ncbi:MAG: DUF1385 domain-containing protein [Oligoflexia bacterium]|nr:DUF1385 domain-containing protein [Oligoflexia bacterium]MBF0366371.1 DUF1385 domain-containing protein [Oligoflexia bacterium]